MEEQLTEEPYILPAMAVDEPAMAVDEAVDEAVDGPYILPAMAVDEPVDGAMAVQEPTNDHIILLRELLLVAREPGQCLAGCGQPASAKKMNLSKQLQGFVDSLTAIDEQVVSTSFCCGSCIMWSFQVRGWLNRPAELRHGPRCPGGRSKPEAGELVDV